MVVILECQIAKIKMASYKKHSGTKLNQFQPMFLRYRHFHAYAIISNGPWQPSWIVNLHKFEIVQLKKSKRLHTKNILAQSWINFIQCFLRYCHFHVFAFFLGTGPEGHLGLSICINMK